MVCKKFQVYDWFRTLDGAKRIDFLNGILHICFPLELRFLASCIEELARKDYDYLRDAEIKANTSQEIQLMHDITDKLTRSKMIVTLALLASNNFECARLLYDLLNIDINDLLDKMQLSLDEKIADEFLLLLTMAANHPAFDFQMKSKMGHLYICAEQKLKKNRIISKDSETDLCLYGSENSSSTNSTTTATTTTATKKPQTNGLTHNSSANLNQTSNTTIQNEATHYANDEDIKENVIDFTTTHSTKHEVVLVDNNNNKNNDDLENSIKLNELLKSPKIKQVNLKMSDDKENMIEKPLIESINFEGVQTIKGTDNYKFIIKIQWSDKTVNEIDKTYSELCEFNKQLISLFPAELDGLIENSNLVLKENQKEDFIKELPLVTDYCSKISRLPKVVSGSEFLRSFFRPSNMSETLNQKTNSITTTTTTNENSNELEKSLKTNKAAEKSQIELYKETSATTASVSNKSSTESSINEAKKKRDDTSDSSESQTEKQSTSSSINNPSSINAINEKVSSSSTANQSKFANTTTASSSAQSSSKNKNVAVVSVANLMNNNGNQYQDTTSKKSLNNIANIVNNLSSNQSFNYHNYHPKIIQPHGIPYGAAFQPLPLHTFQPISNMMISSPPCASPTPNNQANNNNNNTSTTSNSAGLNGSTNTNNNSSSVNNSRSSSPWMMMPPPPAPLNLLPPHHQANYLNSLSNISMYNNPYQNFNKSHSNNNQKNMANYQNSKNHQSYQDDLNKAYQQHQQIDGSLSHDLDKQQTHNQPNNKHGKNSYDYNNRKNNMKPMKSYQNDVQFKEAGNSETKSPKPSSTTSTLSNNNNSNTQNLRSSSSCSSSSYQTPPPSILQLPSPSGGGSNAAIAAYNATMQQYAAVAAQHGSNPNHLIPLTNSQLVTFQQQQQQQQAHGNQALLLAPIVNNIPIGMAQQAQHVTGQLMGLGQQQLTIPVPIPIQGALDSKSPSLSSSFASTLSNSMNKSSKPNNRAMERSRSPESSSTLMNNNCNLSSAGPATSDDEDLQQQQQQQQQQTSNEKSNQIPQKSNVPTSFQQAKQSVNRQHSSNSVSSTSSSSAKVSNKVPNESPSTNGNQQIMTTYFYNQNKSGNEPQAKLVSPTASKTKLLTDSAQEKFTHTKHNSDKESLLDNQETNINKSELSKHESSDSKDLNDSSSTSSYSSTNATTKTHTESSSSNSNKVQASSSAFIGPNLPLITNPAQPMPMYAYQQLASPFAIIEGQNLYAIPANLPPGTISIGPNPTTQTSSSSKSSSFQNSQIPLIPAHHLNPHHPASAQHLQQAQQTPYFNLIPILPPQSAPQFSSTNTNNTPTPGSSPNPNQQTMNLVANNMPPPPPPPQSMAALQHHFNAIDPQLMPYNFHHMMTIANATNSSNSSAAQQQQQQQSIANPNMVMMMMMGGNGPTATNNNHLALIHPPPPPQPQSSLAPSIAQTFIGKQGQQQQQSINFAQYPFIQTHFPNLQQQQQLSPSLNNQIKLPNQKKKSCYNCGSMNHTANECKEPTIESTQTNQFRLNLKPVSNNDELILTNSNNNNNNNEEFGGKNKHLSTTNVNQQKSTSKLTKS